MKHILRANEQKCKLYSSIFSCLSLSEQMKVDILEKYEENIVC